jgi:hypothetical protein
LDELLTHHSEMIVEFETTQLQLAEQREKYKTLQSKHDKDLEDIRQAGHEALVVIVEEYKVRYCLFLTFKMVGPSKSGPIKQENYAALNFSCLFIVARYTTLAIAYWAGVQEDRGYL